MAKHEITFNTEDIVRIIRKSHSHIPPNAIVVLYPSPKLGEPLRVAFEWTTPNAAPESKLAQVREQESNE